jgi:hypothetical protein
MTNKPQDKLATLMGSGLLSSKNAERVARVFYDAAKIVYERQKRLNKPQLKMKEVSSALVLAESLHSQAFNFEAVGVLAENFGTFNEASALEYYEKKVMGSVQDKYGRSIVLDEDGMKSLYKDPISGKHDVSPENYEESRGKRLPWIRHTIQNSGAIYLSEETVAGAFRRTYLYTAIVSIPIQPKPQVSYYVVVVREGKNSTLRLVTAYSMLKRNRFLAILSLTRPYLHV